jgi:hypothetical protein
MKQIIFILAVLFSIASVSAQEIPATTDNGHTIGSITVWGNSGNFKILTTTNLKDSRCGNNLYAFANMYAGINESSLNRLFSLAMLAYGQAAKINVVYTYYDKWCQVQTITVVN